MVETGPRNPFVMGSFVDMIQSRCLSNTDARTIGIDPLRSLVLTSFHRTSASLVEVAAVYGPLKLLKEARLLRDYVSS